MSRRWLAAGMVRAFALALVLGIGTVSARADGFFDHLTGSWAGSGSIMLNTGARERILCRATYAASGGGMSLRLDLKCASDGFKFELHSDLSSADGSITGVWSEGTRRVSGSVTGKGTYERVDLTAVSTTFSALLTVITRGNRQNVTIRSPGSEMQEVTFSMTRGAKR